MLTKFHHAVDWLINIRIHISSLLDGIALTLKQIYQWQTSTTSTTTVL